MKKSSLSSFILIIVFLFGCNSRQTDVIKIGACLPLSGDIASYGKRAQNGINLAISEINNSKRSKIRIIVDFQDNQGLTKEAVNIMNKFCSIDKYSLVFGGASSSESAAMIPIANKYHVVQMSPISSSPDLSENDYFFRVCPSDAYQAVIMAKWLISSKISSIGLIYVKNNWGNSLQDKFIDEYHKIGGKLTDIETLNEGDRDFKTQLLKIINSKPEAIYCISYGAEGGIILKQIKQLGFTNKIFGADVWSSPELLTGAGTAAENVYLVKPAEHSDSLYNEFIKNYQSKYKEQPDVYAAYSYDIIYLLFKTFSLNKIMGDEIRNYFLSMPEFKGVTGITKFDENGDCNSKSFIRLQIRNGKFIQIDK
ncbi:MAG: ABC transporter substrate-binding protein [Bacteroidales bacterium]|jgi:branched-chain amino acid transport system substrate-binding protein